ncbi:DnaJ family domain-containing protein [Heliomicrobium undosum]|nr:DUF1992 domain-containing protein [Heliomicrobium undosum]
MFRILAEQRIREAIDKGELDDLPGKGKPVDLDEMAMVPPEMRAMIRYMKNAGIVPEEVQLLKEIEALYARLDGAKDDAEKEKLKKKMNDLKLQLHVLLERKKGQRA